MRIKAIRVKQFKGVNAQMEDVGRHTLFVGPNGSGKSARLEAIRYAMTGKTSAGDKPDAVMAFASHPSGCGVGVTLDDGFAWDRACNKDSRTKRTTTAISIGGGIGTREADAAVAEHVGRFAPMFNIGAFLDLSADKRRDFILRLCGAEATGDRDLVDDITNAHLRSAMGPGTWDAVMKLPASEFAAAVRDQIGATRLDAANVLMEACGEVMTHGDIATNLAEALVVLKLATSNNKKAADQGTAAARKLADRRAELEIGSETAEALKGRIAELEKHRRELRDDIATVKGRADGITAAKKQIADVDGHLAKIRDTLAEAMTLDLDAADAELEKLRADRVAVVETNDALVSAHATAVAECNERARKADARLTALTGEAANVRLSHDRLRQRINDVKGGPVGRIAKQADIAHEWAMSAGNARPIIECVEAIRVAVSELGDAESLTADMERLGRELDKSDEQRAAQNDELAAVAASLADAERALAEAAGKLPDLDASATEIDALDAKVTTTRNEIHGATKGRDQLLGLRKESEATLQMLTADVSTLDIEATQDLVTGLGVEIDALAVRKRAAESHGQLIAEYNACIASAERATVQHEVSKELANAVRACRETVMASLVFPIVSRLTLYLDIARPDVVPFIDLENDRGRPIFDFGWTDGKRRVSFDAMSGGERALFAAGLAFALVDIADPPLRLLLLEVGEVDGETLTKMLGAIDAVAGNRFQSFVASHGVPDDIAAIGEWTVATLVPTGGA